MRERLFQPLDMKDTGLFVPEDRRARLAATHGKDGKLIVSDDPRDVKLRCRSGRKLPVSVGWLPPGPGKQPGFRQGCDVDQQRPLTPETRLVARNRPFLTHWAHAAPS